MHAAFLSAVHVPIALVGTAGILRSALDSTIWQENGPCELHVLEGKLVLE